ncbi:MAG TPA: PQQ-dependent sugar dehydrogenase [Myxococcaceae bacterium]|nr:PQQ-dependent sugar dehydrogenase [Myxococcaceae bacterium]
MASPLGEVTDFRFLPDGRAVIVEKNGAVRIRNSNGSLTLAGTLPVDSGGEKGLLGVEVDPAFAANGFLYFFLSASDAAGGSDLDRQRVSRFTLRSDGVLDLDSELVLVRNLRGNANVGGALAMGPEGVLYIGAGDGACDSGSPSWSASCLTNGNGKILRVNLDGTIPPDNPLLGRTAVTACGINCAVAPSPAVTGAPREEIWAWGLRNPWRMSFDARTGRLWVGDVGDGEAAHEELNIVQKGKHYGWPLRDGATGQAASQCGTLTPGSADCADPVYFCQHGVASGGVDGDCESITGGRVVDSCTWPAPWRGRYFFGDKRNGLIWALPLNVVRDGVAGPREEFGMLANGTPASFRVGPDGNLYIAAFAPIGGGIVRIAPIAPASQACLEAGGGTTDGGSATDAGSGTGHGTGSVFIGGGMVPPRPAAPSACGCASGGDGVGLLALLALARRLLSRN